MVSKAAIKWLVIGLVGFKINDSAQSFVPESQKFS